MTKIVLAVCNICLADDTETPAAHTEKTTLNGIEYEIDMCDPHYDKWFKPFATELTEHGTRVGGRKAFTKAPQREAMRDPQQCEIGCEKICDGFAGQVQHIRQAHPDEFPKWRASKA